MKGLKQHMYLIAVVLAVFVFYLLFFHNRLYGEINGSFISYGLVMDESYSQGNLPLWSTQLSGGYPLLANPEVPTFGILNLMVWLLPDVVLAFSITTLLHAVLAGVGTALLAFELTKSRHAAVVSGILFVISGGFSYAAFSGTMPFLYPLAFLPWAFLFVYRSQAKPLLYAPLAAAALSMQLLSGGTIYFFWTLLGISVFLGIYALFALLKGNRKLVVRLAFSLGAVILLTLGLSAVTILPGTEFIKLTDRAAGVSYENFIWQYTQISLSSLPAALITSSIVAVGAVALALAFTGFFFGIKKKFAIAFAAITILAILIEIDTFVTKIFFQLPGFGQTRQIYNVFSLVSISLAVMAGVGWVHVLKKVRNHHFAATAAVIAVIAFELLVVGSRPSVNEWEHNFDAQIEKNLLIQNISNDQDMFRLHLYGEDFVGLSLAKYAIPYGIRMFDWTTGNVWFNDYATYTTAAGQLGSAKMWGMANVKYIASREQISIPGLEFVGEFGDCITCDLKARYLYKNLEFLPEAYVVQQPTLIIGDEQAGFRSTFAVIQDQSFSPSRTAIVNSAGVPLLLDRYGLIMPATSPMGESDRNRLLAFLDAGGIVEPMIFDNADAVDYAAISTFFTTAPQVTEAQPEVYDPNKVALTAPSSGLLVISEKFYKFDGWKATVNGKEVPKLTVNLISTGVFVDEGDKVVFEYHNSAFSTGLLITVISLMIAILLPFSGKLLKPKQKSTNHG